MSCEKDMTAGVEKMECITDFYNIDVDKLWAVLHKTASLIKKVEEYKKLCDTEGAVYYKKIRCPDGGEHHEKVSDEEMSSLNRFKETDRKRYNAEYQLYHCIKEFNEAHYGVGGVMPNLSEYDCLEPMQHCSLLHGWVRKKSPALPEHDIVDKLEKQLS